jgi:saccharopine dehydrogenase (NAD+, L-lysine-forming)
MLHRLSVFVDVSCDTTNPNNPFPIYSATTTLEKPVVRVAQASGSAPALDVIAIDHLPSLVPSDSSADFSSALLPHLVNLKNCTTDGVWTRAERLFEQRSQEAAQALAGN